MRKISRLLHLTALSLSLFLAATSVQAAAKGSIKAPEKYAEIVADLLDGEVDAANSKIRERLAETPNDEVLFYLQATLKSLPFYPQYDQAEAIKILKKPAANDEGILSKYALLRLSYPMVYIDLDKADLKIEELKGLTEKLNSTEHLDKLANYQKDILTKANISFDANPNIVLKMYDFDNLLAEQHFNGFGYAAMPQILEYKATNSNLSNRYEKLGDLLTREGRINGFPGASYIMGKMAVETQLKLQDYGWFLIFSDAFIGNTYALDYIDKNFAEIDDAALRDEYLSIYVNRIIKQDQPSLNFCKDIDDDSQGNCIVYSKVHDLECFNLQLSEEFNIPDFHGSRLYKDCRRFYLKKAARH